MPDSLFQQYLDAAEAVSQFDNQLSQAKTRRAEAAQDLFERDGKGQTYEVGGMSMIVCKSKTGTYFLTPKNKRRVPKKKPNKVEISAKLKPAASVSTAGDPDVVDMPPQMTDPEKVVDEDPLAGVMADLGI